MIERVGWGRGAGCCDREVSDDEVNEEEDEEGERERERVVSWCRSIASEAHWNNSWRWVKSECSEVSVNHNACGKCG